MTAEVYLPDTHALFWYEFNSPRLSPGARQAFDSADQGEARFVLHPMVLAEFYYVLCKSGYEQHFLRYLEFLDQSPIYRLESITREDLGQLPEWTEIPEMHDRLIAITASRLDAVLLTKDAVLQACERVRFVW